MRLDIRYPARGECPARNRKIIFWCADGGIYVGDFFRYEGSATMSKTPKTDTKTFFRREPENAGLVDLLIKMNADGYSRALIETECRKRFPGCGVNRNNLDAILAHYGHERIDKQPEHCATARRRQATSKERIDKRRNKAMGETTS